MQKIFAPASREIVELLKEAANQGRFVMMLPTPDQLADADIHVDRGNRTSSLIATCCLRFKLTYAESCAFTKLMEQEHATKEELRTAISRNPMTGLKNVDVVICRVRQKLKSYGVKVINIWGQGYALDKKARDKIDRLLAPQSKPKAPEPGLFENPRAP